jgi:hypothetical protein
MYIYRYHVCYTSVHEWTIESHAINSFEAFGSSARPPPRPVTTRRTKEVSLRPELDTELRYVPKEFHGSLCEAR